MTPLWWFGAASVLSWGVIELASDGRWGPELLFGMLGPLAAVCGSWIAIVRGYRVNPERLTGVMVTGLAIKAVFFGVYVVVMLRGLDLRPAAFVGSFTGYFLALYGLEALFLKRLFEGVRH